MSDFKGNTVEELKEWINDGNDPTINSIFMDTPLSKACRRGYLEIVKYLLSDEMTTKFPEIDPTKDDNFCLGDACFTGSLEIVQYLLSKEITKKFPGIDPSDDENTGLYCAIYENHPDIVKYLLEEQSHKFPKLRNILYNTELIEELNKLHDYKMTDYLNNFKRKIDLNNK